ncbi:MAG: tyrosine-protein phosphatase [Clostridiales bacterium]|nr:tyrosine-protein phosphatase [Clostridiales bacterium]
MQYRRRYILDNLINCRDLGGYTCNDGSVTRFGRLLRAGMPRPLSEKDLRFLEEYGVKAVLDLRGNKEAELYPAFMNCETDISYKHISLLEINPATMDLHRPLIEAYRETIDNYGEALAESLRFILNSGTPFLFHCFIGKDRTGMLAAMILHMAGVNDEDIVADYEISYSYLENFFRHEMEIGSGLIWECDEHQRRSDRGNMISLLEYINSKFGSIEDYLLGAGMTEEELKALSTLLK